MEKKILLMTVIILAVAGLGILLLFKIRQSQVGPNPDPVPIGATTQGIQTIIDANNQFAVRLYAEVKKEKGNIFFSPYSISTALAMTYEGARGKTAEEIESVFHFPKDAASRRSAFAAVHNQLNKRNSNAILRIANALWAQKDFKFLDEYVRTLRAYYGGEATTLNFMKALDASRKTINAWVEGKTNNKIKNLFPEGSLTSDTRLVLTNAIYFKGTWVKQFEKNKTQNEDFRITPSVKVKVPLMQRADKDATFNYAETENLQVLELPYEGKRLSMMVLLPKNDDIASLENALTVETLRDWRAKLTEQRVDVFLPRFTFSSKYSLNDTLKKFGMPTAFTDGADFSGMDGTKSLSIQTVVHQAFVDVNEEGTEAAAATGVGVGITSAPLPPPVFQADHPFIFLIQDKENGNILFLGRVSDPTK